jgi:uncharacterized protein YndB with AHSA1/START domain
VHQFEDAAVVPAPLEEVWKLIVDPTRYPEWWAGIARTEAENPDEFTLYHPDEPERPWPQRVEQRSDGRVVISCMTSAIRYAWSLQPRDGATAVEIAVEIPDDWADHVDSQRALIRESLGRLGTLAAA